MRRQRNSGSVIPLLLVLLALAGAGVAVYWFYFKKQDEKPQFQTVPVKKGDVVQAVTATGTLHAVISVEVGSQISGIIKTLHADFNTNVKSGQVIAQLDPATYEAISNQNEGELASAQANLELATLNEKRKRELVLENAAPQADLDKAVADLHQAEATVKIKQAVLQKSKIDLARCTITAPVDGVVIERKVDVGQTVAATMTAPVLFTIANDLAKMQIEANVSEADIGGVKVGQIASFLVDAFPGRTFEGKVQMVRYAPITVENVVTYVTIIEVANPKLELRPGMTANVSIVLAKREDVITVSNAALRFKPAPAAGADGRTRSSKGEAKGKDKDKGGQHKDKEDAPEASVAKRTVHVLENGEPKPVEIETGITDGVITEVITGLKEDQEVVTSVYTSGAAAAAPSMGSPFGGAPRR
ncbi:MAG: hypothetical protein RL693_1231 [Verrucomicrobiota bacterium]|jgi:HlyD family secretion protein